MLAAPLLWLVVQFLLPQPAERATRRLRVARRAAALTHQLRFAARRPTP